ncbi:hypothetical protein PspP127CL_11855 [Pseudomonas syringae]|uniref:Uncharacterized protein n=1 Tax=Pseudomonas syringae TaxID=317 RepID=A0A6B2ASL9_PSESX|nr:hypothetical protein [Pseudomonas syringae]NAO61024.1 hypothetical protein [Pseudomonas syringae]NAO76131.1 hypothetical protein [Pseudomonas syringae]NAP89862.1 hypothetical protein [Pseudomonas syringae]
MLAKTVFQSMHFRRFYRPFREQARSHRAGVFSSHVKHSHRYGVFSSHVDYSHRSTVFRAMRMPCGTDDLVGVSLLAKAVFQSMHFRRLCRPFREQARSHRAGVFSSHVKNSTGPGCLQAMWITHTGRLCFEPCECPAALMTLWERACSRRRCFSRCIFGACTDPFASKLAPTGTGCLQAM